MDLLAPDGALRNRTAEVRIAQLVEELDALERQGDAASWEKATAYVIAYDELGEEPEFKGKHGQALTRAINNRIRAHAQEAQKQIPRPSFLAHAKRLADTWKEIFAFKSKLLPYQHYSQIAVCGLPRERKDTLRAWAEKVQPTQAELRQTIRTEVDAHNGTYRPDFERKAANFWRFNEAHDNGGYGGVHPAVFANLMYWYTEPGQVVLDPFAGSGLLEDTLQKYRFFRECYQAEGSGPRIPLLSDIAPTRGSILQADARVGLPFDDAVADLAILDPPYLRVADRKKYANLGKTLEEWKAGFRDVLANVLRCVKPGGLIAVMTDDVLRSDEHIPVADEIRDMLRGMNLKPWATICNHNPNYIYTMAPPQMYAARRSRMLVNGCKMIRVVRKPPGWEATDRTLGEAELLAAWAKATDEARTALLASIREPSS
jgi:hypothetical protein